jgi:excisionase family DNA binding protein
MDQVAVDARPPRLLVRVEEAAHMLSLSRSKVYELLAAGDIEAIAIGRSRLIPVDGLHDYINRLRQADGR